MNHLTSIDPVERFTAIQSALAVVGDWHDRPAWTRFAAVTATLSPLEPSEAASRIRAVAEVLRKGSPWYGELASPLRFVLSALLVVDGIEPERFSRELPRDHELFRECGIRHGGQYETMAIAILRHLGLGHPLIKEDATRLKGVYDGLKRFHWWLAGPDDLPPCACLTAMAGDPGNIAVIVDQHYKLLQGRGFTSGNHLLIGSQLLSLASLPAERAVERFTLIAKALDRHDLTVWHEDYDAIALLCMLDQDAEIVATRLREILERIGRLEPRIIGQAHFNLAADLTVLDLIRSDAKGIRPHTGDAFKQMLARLHLFTAAALLLTSSADSVASGDAIEWPLGAPLYPLGGGGIA